MPLPEPSPNFRRSSARETVFEQIRSWIEDAQLEPGETLKDADIAEYFGVSRTPVREALQMLEQNGLVQTKPGRSTKVTQVDMRDAALVYPLLGVLFGLSTELVAETLPTADLETMIDANERLLAAAERGDVRAVRDADRQFHFVCVRAADNRYLEQAVVNAEMHARRLETIYFGEIGATRTSYGEHLDIIEALRERDGQRANALTQANYARSAKTIAAHIEAHNETSDVPPTRR